MARKATLMFALLAAAAMAYFWIFHTTELKPINRHTSDWACLNNLRLFDSAKQQWALERSKTTNDYPTWDDMRAYLGRGSNGQLPECPIHGVYRLGRVGEKTSCSIHGTVQDPR
jgi:sensor domain CHASE-containing protein